MCYQPGGSSDDQIQPNLVGVGEYEHLFHWGVHCFDWKIAWRKEALG
jgi:hypothetical protein